MNLLIPLASPQVNSPAAMSELGPEALLTDRRQAQVGKLAPAINEQSWHTQAAKCFSTGMTPTEVADFCDCSVALIYRLLKTPWFQERVTQYMEKQGVDLLSLFKTAAVGAYATVVEICNDVEAPKAVRVNAAKEILERTFGKAKQIVEVGQTPVGDPVQQVEALSKELALLRQQT